MVKISALFVGAALPVTFGLLIHTQSDPEVSQPEHLPKTANTIFATGRIEGTTPEIELRSHRVGRSVKQILVEEGQWVQQGELLLQVDDEQDDRQVALAAAELQLARAQLERLKNGARQHERTEADALYRAKKAELERAHLTWKRGNRLRERQVIGQQQADDQRTLVKSLVAELRAAKARVEQLNAPAQPDDVKIAEARVQIAQAQLELARFHFEMTRLRAPVSGKVLEIGVELGELTGPDSAEPVVVIADTSGLFVRTFVEELDAPQVAAGMTAKIIADGLPGEQLTGCVTRISPNMSRKQLWSGEPSERFDTKVLEVCIKCEALVSLPVGLRVDVVIDRESLEPTAKREDRHKPLTWPGESRLAVDGTRM